MIPILRFCVDNTCLTSSDLRWPLFDLHFHTVQAKAYLCHFTGIFLMVISKISSEGIFKIIHSLQQVSCRGWHPSSFAFPLMPRIQRSKLSYKTMWKTANLDSKKLLSNKEFSLQCVALTLLASKSNARPRSIWMKLGTSTVFETMRANFRHCT